MSDKEAEQWNIIHALKGDYSKIGQCAEQCGDSVCNYGCLRQSAQTVWRSSIMHGIQTVRETGSTEYPLNVGAYLGSNHECPAGQLGEIGSNRRFCKDPVCRVTGCLNVPAWRFRLLIKIALDNEIIDALKK